MSFGPAFCRSLHESRGDRRPVRLHLAMVTSLLAILA